MPVLVPVTMAVSINGFQQGWRWTARLPRLCPPIRNRWVCKRDELIPQTPFSWEEKGAGRKSLDFSGFPLSSQERGPGGEFTSDGMQSPLAGKAHVRRRGGGSVTHHSH